MTKACTYGLIIASCLCVCVFSLQAQNSPHDLILRNGRIVDGTASSWYRGDIVIRGDTIVRIASSVTGPAAGLCAQ
jgi:adenine deaminase